MSKLTHIQRFRFTQNDMLLFTELKKNRVNISSFVRKAIREKIQKDLPKLIQAENKRNDKIECPF
jgi:post-segregation antitoxin (ccd killing protein)